MTRPALPAPQGVPSRANRWLPGAPERRAASRATPGRPFGRRASDEAVFGALYPAPFVAQAAALSQDQVPGAAPLAAPARGYGVRTAPAGLVNDVKA